ncbi:MAG TPA: phage baseplate assembly protein V [Gaiellaceae bacterium]|jgi:uncharacterized protein involved in type VI secretion and phage assembly
MNRGLTDLLGTGRETQRIYGVVTAVVTNNKDPDKLGRVKLKFPWLIDSEESWWARVVAPMAGKDRGVYFLPEVDDEVLVAFEHGDPRYPYVVGALWSSNRTPPETNDDGKNNHRTVKSRSGHIVRFDDTDGEEKIEILDRSGKNSIVVSSKDNTLTIKADGDITIESTNGKVKLSGKGIVIDSSADLTVQAQTTAKVESKSQLTLKGATVAIN